MAEVEEVKQLYTEKLGMHPGWWDLLSEILLSKELSEIYGDLGRIREGGGEIFPEQDKLWRAFSFDPKDLKVIILGQDPYHTPKVANGYAFAVGKANYVPPSLRNIVTVLRETYGDKPRYSKALGEGDYRNVWGEHQASQGVLLLNRALTVERGQPGSHLDLWEPVISKIMEVILTKFDGLIWILWGSPAINAWTHATGKGMPDENKIHTALCSTHPSPFSWDKDSKNSSSFKSRGGCFEEANEFIVSAGKEPIDW